MVARGGLTGGGGLRAVAAIALAIIALAFAIAAPRADATATRAEYVAQVDPICKSASRQAVRSLKGIKLPREERLDQLSDKEAFRFFFSFIAKAVGRSNKAIGPAIAQIALVPPAPGDERIVALWVQALGDYMVFSNRAVEAANHDRLNKFFYYTGKAGLVGEQANNLVDDWGFRYCASDDSGYSGTSATGSATSIWLTPHRLVANVDRAREMRAGR